MERSETRTLRYWTSTSGTSAEGISNVINSIGTSTKGTATGIGTEDTATDSRYTGGTGTDW